MNEALFHVFKLDSDGLRVDYEGQELMYKFRPLVLKTNEAQRGYDKWDEFVKQFDAWKANTLFAIF